MSAEAAAGIIADLVDSIITTTRASERILATMGTVTTAVDALAAIADVDPELVPELGVALNHLHETADALRRAHVFISARYNTDIDKLHGRSIELDPENE